MTTITITNARKKLYELIQQVQTTHEPIIIAGKESCGVLISQEDFDSI